ncbi:uncharacterized protein [Aegilops tauschii subsp. strangulata]|nr:uncharacterized protein LOC109769771 [Aegilops tauschii subsp. strangulata]
MRCRPQPHSLPLDLDALPPPPHSLPRCPPAFSSHSHRSALSSASRPLGGGALPIAIPQPRQPDPAQAHIGLLIVLLNLLLPPALLSNFLRDGVHHASTHNLLDQARGFHFRSSLVDLPAVSAARSLILCAYTACGGGAAYLWAAAACSIGSLFYVLAKAAAVFGVAADGAAGLELHGKGQLLALAYRASSREKRRLHVVYRVNIEVATSMDDIDDEDNDEGPVTRTRALLFTGALIRTTE